MYYILGQYMNITHNLLYKTWAYWPGVYIDILYIKFKVDEEQKKEKIKIKTLKRLKMYTCIY